MQIKQLKQDHWYETTKGPGKCLTVSKTSAKFDFPARFNMPGEVEWLSPKEVKYELPKEDAERQEAVYEDSKNRTPDSELSSGELEDQPEEVEKNRVRQIVGVVTDNCNDAWQSLAESAADRDGASARLTLLKAAMHALRSYQYGNASTLLAEEVADAIEGALAQIKKANGTS